MNALLRRLFIKMPSQHDPRRRTREANCGEATYVLQSDDGCEKFRNLVVYVP
jgi:hypothetical protein